MVIRYKSAYRRSPGKSACTGVRNRTWCIVSKFNLSTDKEKMSGHRGQRSKRTNRDAKKEKIKLR